MYQVVSTLGVVGLQKQTSLNVLTTSFLEPEGDERHTGIIEQSRAVFFGERGRWCVGLTKLGKGGHKLGSVLGALGRIFGQAPQAEGLQRFRNIGLELAWQRHGILQMAVNEHQGVRVFPWGVERSARSE